MLVRSATGSSVVGGPRVIFRNVVVPLAAVTVALLSAGPAWGHAGHGGHADQRGVAQASGSESAFYGVGDASGYHVYRATSDGSHGWRELATIRPRDLDDDSWLGYQCVTSTGRYVVAVVAQRHAANDAELGNAGANAYAIDTSTGSVRPLISGVALKYHSPGCGTGDRVALPAYSGAEGAVTDLKVLDASSGKLVSSDRLETHVTSAMPLDDAVVAADGTSIVTVRRNRIVSRVQAGGVVYKIRARRRGVAFLARTGKTRTLVQGLVGGRLRTLGKGDLQRTDLLPAGREALLVGADRAPTANAGDHLSRIAWPIGLTEVASVSNDGKALIGHSANAKPEPRGHDHNSVADMPRVPPVLVSRATAHRSRPDLPSDLTTAVVTETAKLTASARVATTRGGTPNTTTPKCAVPRNDLRRQVPQASTTQINWAIQQAIRGNLKGSVLTRPANFLNMNLVSYQPSSDFAPTVLSGGGQIPPSVAQAIYAQETNWKQASFHALPGLSGNPSVSDYYGSKGGLDAIDYDKADCGYGVSQVTDPMAVSSPQYSANGKTKVGVDYAENIAAGLQILADKWNQLKNAGVTVNGGNPAYLENWYFAIWAYNSGFHAQGAAARWGLGWTNNPQNADYNPARLGFLRATYADASHPADWPYQERVIGFMESPLLNYKGVASYAKPFHGVSGATHFLTLPAYSAFCAPAPLGNECSPTYDDPVDPTKSYCTRSDRECWWHAPVQFADCATDCTTSTFTVAATEAEPAGDDNYPPACDSTLPAGSIIVDDQPSNLNVEGCGTGNWANAGTFAIAHGSSGGVPIGMIDWHQLGTGFGGHTYFTHNRAAADTAHTETGTWTPSGITSGRYSVSAHIPASGASAEAAQYVIHRGDGTTATRTINQHLHANRWIPLGTYTLLPGAKVVLTNTTTAPSGTTNVGYDAIGFTKLTSTVPTQPAAQLAQDYRPALFFDSSEKWRPLNVNELLTELRPDGQPTHARCIDAQAASTPDELAHDPFDTIPDRFEVPGNDPTSPPTALCAPIHQESDLTKWRSDRSFLMINRSLSADVSTYASPYAGCRVGSLLDCNGGEAGLTSKSGIYYDVIETPGYDFLAYWMFYRFNSFSDATHLFNHQGDWEAVAVAPNASGSFDFASFSGHGHWYSYLRSSLTCVDQPGGSCGTDDERAGKRVKVFVANGSHANYGTPCSEVVPGGCPQSSGPWPDRGYDGQAAWGRNGDAASVAPLPVVGSGGWNDWAGHWGATGSPLGVDSPQSPAAQAMYGKPWDTCARAQNGCPLPSSRSVAPSGGQGSPLVPGSEVRSPTGCSSWFGPGVNGLLCDPVGLKRRIAAGRLTQSTAVRLSVVRRPGTRAGRAGGPSDARAGAARVVAQTLGAPLAAGDALRVSGAMPRGAVVLARARRRDGRVVELRWKASGGSRDPVLRVVSRDGGRLALRSR